MRPEVIGFFHKPTFSVSYLVFDPATRRGLIIDPVLDYDHRSGHTSTGFADALLEDVRRREIAIDWLLETHIHADHLSAQAHLKAELGAPTAIGAAAPQVQTNFKAIYNLGPEFTPDGSQFDRLLAEGETLAIGGLSVEVMATPGHTPACVSYRIGDALFHGDTLFMPDYGTARCDFPGASWRCRPRRGCSIVTTMGRTGGPSPGRPRWRCSAGTISTSRTASMKPPSSPCAAHATRH
jgi:glyoxylase-like metal-dependent hydrolase (beta-lactamase superfamily II)